MKIDLYRYREITTQSRGHVIQIGNKPLGRRAKSRGDKLSIIKEAMWIEKIEMTHERGKRR